MKRILIACAFCNGTGRSILSKPLMAALAAIRESSPCTASEVYARLAEPGLDRSSANQRIKRLMKLGFVKSKKAHRKLRVYWPV